jgi:hypothetical protein
VNSSISSFRRWLVIFFALILGVWIPFLAASEWMLRTYVLPVDGFEEIVRRINNSNTPNAAFGDSHAAAVSDFNEKGFVNLGLGGTTIRQMSERAHYYFTKVKPGEVIIEADSHLFADYRLEAPGVHVPDSYALHRLAVFDERHRGFLLDYWERFKTEGLKPKESNRPDQLWKITNGLASSEAPPPATNSATPPSATNVATQPTPQAPAPAQRQPDTSIPPPPAETVVKKVSADSTTPSVRPAPQQQAAPVAPDKDASEPNGGRGATGTDAEFNAFMDYEVRTHTPVDDFRQRDEARIYAEMIDFLIARGARVCLMTYPVDRFYRERADNIPTFLEVRQFYQNLARERNIPYVSFWSRFDDPAMFQNTDHVGPRGSAILAKEARRACFSD